MAGVLLCGLRMHVIGRETMLNFNTARCINDVNKAKRFKVKVNNFGLSTKAETED